jgi:hypothetical protein
VLLARQGRPNIAAIAADDARRLAGQHVETLMIRFADITGTMEDILAGVTGGMARPTSAQSASAELAWPLAFRLRIDIGSSTRMIRTPNGEPLVVAGDIFATTGKAVWRLDPAADDVESAVVWKAPHGLASSPPVGFWGRSPLLPMGLLHSDGRTLLLVSGGNVVSLDVATGEKLGEVMPLLTNPVAGPKVSRLIAADGAGDTWVLLDDKGSLFCLVGPAFQSVRWRAGTAEHLDQYSASVRIVGDIVLVTDERGGQAWAFGLTTGKLLTAPWRGRPLATHLSETGVLVVVSDNDLIAYADGRFDQPVWRRTLPADGSLRLICGDAGRMVVAYTSQGPRAEVIELTAGDTIARVAPAKVDGQGAFVRAGRLAGDDLYLFSPDAAARAGEPMIKCEQAAHCQRIDLKTSRVLWARRISTQRGYLLRPLFTDNVMFSGDGREHVETKMFLIDTGERTNVPQEYFVLANSTDTPAVVGTRLVVTTNAGVNIYGQAK